MHMGPLLYVIRLEDAPDAPDVPDAPGTSPPSPNQAKHPLIPGPGLMPTHNTNAHEYEISMSLSVLGCESHGPVVQVPSGALCPVPMEKWAPMGFGGARERKREREI